MPTYNGETLTITLDSGITSIDWIDVYSDWKDWLLSDPTNRGYPQAFRTTGGDPLNALLNAGSYWFLRNDLGWRIKPPEENITILASGNLAPENADTDMFLPTIGTYTTQVLGLQPITQGFSPELGSGLAYNLFGGGVSLDIINGVPGTESPIGDQEHPSNNLADAIAIANANGFKKLFIRESMIGADAIDAGTNIQGFTLIGESEVNTRIEIDPSAICEDLTIKKCDVFGTLDGGTHIEDCSIGDLNYVSGHIHHCGLYGTIVLAGNEEAVVENCFTTDQDNPVTIDMGGSGQDLSMPNYAGLVTIINLTSTTEEIGIGLNAGMVILDSTITAGNIIISGIGVLQNNSTSVTYLNTDALLSRELIHKTTWNTIYIEVGSGNSGVNFPTGTEGKPVDNFTDALTIASNNNIEKFHVHGSISLLGDCSGYIFSSDSYEAGAIDFNGQNMAGTVFNSLSLSGIPVGHFDADNCIFPSGGTDFNAHMNNCILAGSFTVAVGETLNMDRCTFPENTTFDLNGTGSLNAANISGVITLINATDAGCKIGITGYFLCTFHSSCTDGIALAAGIGILNNDSTMNVTERAIPQATWDEPLTGATYNDPTTAGRRLRDIGTSVIHSDTAQGPGMNNNHIVLSLSAADFDGAYDPAMLAIVDGTGVGQSRLILQYEGSTRTATIDRGWKVQPDNTSEYVIHADTGREHVNEGLIQSATTNTVTLNTLASSVDDMYIGQVILIRSGTGEDQSRRCIAYDGITKIATVGRDWLTTPDSTSAYVMLPTATITHQMISDAVWADAEALIIRKMLYNKVTKSGDVVTIYEDNGSTIWKQFDLTGGGRVEV